MKQNRTCSVQAVNAWVFTLPFFQFLMCWEKMLHEHWGGGTEEDTILMEDPNPKERKGRKRD